MLDVCLLGTAGMMPLPNRWLTALSLKYNGSNILIDCGEGTQIAMKEAGINFKPIDILCITFMQTISADCRGFFLQWEMPSAPSRLPLLDLKGLQGLSLHFGRLRRSCLLR